jgi:hypothetical protein
MGRGDDAHVGVKLALAPHSFKRAVLKHAEQTDLGGGRELADLIEEEGASIGTFEPAEALGLCSCEAPTLVAEEFRVDEFGRGLHRS